MLSDPAHITPLYKTFVVNLAPIDETQIGILFHCAIKNCPHTPAPAFCNDHVDVVPPHKTPIAVVLVIPVPP